MEPWCVSKYPELFPHVYIVFIIKLIVYKMLISSCWELSKAIRLLFSFRQQMMSTNQVHQSFQSMSRRNRKSRKDRKERERQKKKRK